MKNFFNLDKEISLSIVVVALLVIGAIKIKFQELLTITHIIGIKIREVFYAVKEQLYAAKEEPSSIIPIHHHIRSHVRKDIWRWQLHNR